MIPRREGGALIAAQKGGAAVTLSRAGSAPSSPGPDCRPAPLLARLSPLQAKPPSGGITDNGHSEEREPSEQRVRRAA
jgi:hypothetical protein